MKRQINYAMLDAVNMSGRNARELSLMAGLGQSHISNVINGGHQLSIRSAKMIQKVIPGWNYEEALSSVGKRMLGLSKQDTGIQSILELMERRDINQRMIADKIGMAHSCIRDVMSGSRPLSRKIAFLIQDAFAEFDAEKALGINPARRH